MNNCLDDEEIVCLIDNIKAIMGDTISEADNPNWCSLLKMSIEELYSILGQHIILEQWGSLVGKNIKQTDVCKQLTHKTLDYEESFTYAYSKQVGLQSRGDYELKIDYIEIEPNIQTYIIPKGREVNSVLWMTPSDIDQALFQNFLIGGYNNYGNPAMGLGGNHSSGASGYYIAPAFDTMLKAMDIGLKNRMRQSDLTYKITAGQNGVKLLHLYSVPNHGNTIGVRWQTTKCKVWYHYYDVNGLSDIEVEKCLNKCDDIIKYPSQIPIEQTGYCDLNIVSKVWVRRYMTAMVKESIGRVRGKFGGKFVFPNAELTMEYETLLAESKEEKEKLNGEIKEWLSLLQSDKMLERKANESDNLQKSLQKIPLGMYVI
jgi:hypothetical protein